MIFHAVTEDERNALIEYLMLKIGVKREQLVGDMPFEIAAVSRDNRAFGAILMTNFRGTSVEICVAGDPGWLSLGDLRNIMHHIFIDKGVLRAWACIARTNGPSRLLAKKMGCREIGVLEDEYGPGCDGILYSMTRNNCRWIKGKVD